MCQQRSSSTCSSTRVVLASGVVPPSRSRAAATRRCPMADWGWVSTSVLLAISTIRPASRTAMRSHQRWAMARS